MPRAAAASGSTMPAQDGESFLDAAQNARLVAVGRALLPDHVLRRRRDPGTCATRHMFETLEHLLEAARPGVEGGGLGAQLAHRRRALHRDGRGPRRAQHRPALPRALRRRGRADRLRHPHRHGRRGVATGTATMEIKRVRPSHRDSYERLCHDAGVAALPARPRPATRRCADACWSRGWSGSSASSTGPRPSCMSHYSEAVPAAAVRRLRLVRRDDGGHAARTHARAQGVPDTYPFGL